MCVEALDQVVLPLVTTWPAFTEAMYLLARAGGIRAQCVLWRLVETGRLVVSDLSPSTVDRSARLMDQYADRPMDLAYATLVALAEIRAITGSSPSIPTSGSTGSAADGHSR